jgi:hypothetical protein
MNGSELENSLRSYLRPGEVVRWTGRPARGFRLSSRDGFLIPFSIAWCGFAVFWTVMATIGTFASGSGSMLAFPLFGIPFMLVGLYMVVGRFMVDAWVRDRTVYAVTDRRALILRRILSEHLIAADLGGEVRITRASGGRGTIEFGPASPWAFGRFGGSWAMWTPALSSAPTFIGVDDVMQVYALVNRDPDPVR